MKLESVFTIKEDLHESNSSIVHRALRKNDSRAVILKVLKSKTITQEKSSLLQKEAIVLSKFDYTGIIQVIGLEEFDEGLVLILEDFEAISLSESLKQNFRFNVKIFLELALQLPDTLEQLNKRKVIHRDINPSNIVWNQKTGALKLIDFGLSTFFGENNENTLATSPLVGTLSYISPEQTGRINQSVDYRTDFYSLGVTLYELFSGAPPFPALDPLELIHCHIAKSPKNISKIISDAPSMICKIIMKLMEKSPSDRYQSAIGLKTDLQKCLAQFISQNSISEFQLAQKEYNGAFNIPNKLYGCQSERNELTNSLNRIIGGTLKMVLVSGDPGVGKTSLVFDFSKEVIKKGGFFISGKYDRQKRNIPYTSLVQAFQDLVRQILTEHEEKIYFWKEKIVSSLGKNGKIITDVIPDVKLLIGEQSAVPELPPLESGHRFKHVFKKFMDVFADKNSPLVIFLDDLQWVDLPTLGLLELLLTDPDSKHILIIGAYRNQQVDQSHPLTDTVNTLKTAGVSLLTMTLTPLESKDATALIQDTMNTTSEQLVPLVDLCLQKTGGNPYFLSRYINSLHKQELITFNDEKEAWSWDIQTLKKTTSTLNVLEFIAGKVKDLTKDTKEIIQIASCLGSSFKLRLLYLTAEKNTDEVLDALQEAVIKELIIPVQNIFDAVQKERAPDSQYFRFSHDHVQHAAYALLPKDQRAETHLRIGKLLLDRLNPQEREENLFEITNSINKGAHLIQKTEALMQLIKLNMKAGKKAKLNAAFLPSLQYIRQGMELLPEDAWDSEYSLTFEFYKERAVLEYLNGCFDTSQQLISTLNTHAQTLEERIEIQAILIVQLTVQGKYKEVLDAGKKILQDLNVKLPESDFQKEISNEIDLARKRIQHHNIDSMYSAPTLTSFDKVSAIRILNLLEPAGFFLGREWHTIIVMKSVNISLHFGHTAESAYTYTCFGIILGWELCEYKLAYDFGKLAFHLSHKFKSRTQICKSNFIFAEIIHHWVKPLKEAEPLFNEAYEAGLEVGEMQYAGYILTLKILNRIARGVNINDILNELDSGLSVSKKTGNLLSTDMMRGYQLIALNLTNAHASKSKFDSEVISDKEFVEGCKKYHHILALTHFTILKAQVLFLYGEMDSAFRYSEENEKNLPFIAGQILVAEHTFYYSLILTARFPEASSKEKEIYLVQLEKNLGKLKMWKENCSKNFNHKYLLILAEMAFIKKKPLKAMELYDEAIDEAKKNKFIQDEAVANELAGRFWLSRGKESFAHIYFNRAVFGYEAWGAKHKSTLLEKEFPYLIGETSCLLFQKKPSSDSSFSESIALDLKTVIKASHALTSEVGLRKLLFQLMKIVLENAGAEKGCLIMKKSDQYVVEAEMNTSLDTFHALKAIPIFESGDWVKQPTPVSKAMIQYAIRTKENLVLDNASQKGPFVSDPYIKRVQPKSVLCLPLLNLGKLIGILYFENNLIEGAFTEERINLLNLLSTQMAISIENARIFDHMEFSIKERTTSLKQANEKLQEEIKERQAAESEKTILVEKLKKVNRELSDFAYIVSHDLKAPLRSINILSQIICKDYETVVDEEGKEQFNLLIGQVKRMHNLIEGILQYSRVGREQEGLEQVNVTELITTVIDFIQLPESIKIIKENEFPEFFCNKTRLQQVFENLISNAIKYMDKPTGEIRIGCKDTDDYWTYFVQDNGMGISKEYFTKIFQIFEILSPDSDGNSTGVGLSIVKKIVEMYGGQVWVESEPGKGSVFYFTLPKQ